MTSSSELSLRVMLSIAQVGAFILVLIWTAKYLHGFKLAPVAMNEENTNDTGKHKALSYSFAKDTLSCAADLKFRIVNIRACIRAGQLFNWHPVLMVLAFPIIMSEALLAYRSVYTKNLQRCGFTIG